MNEVIQLLRRVPTLNTSDVLTVQPDLFFLFPLFLLFIFILICDLGCHGMSSDAMGDLLLRSSKLFTLRVENSQSRYVSSPPLLLLGLLNVCTYCTACMLVQ